jgi:hypothetical protein
MCRLRLAILTIEDVCEVQIYISKARLLLLESESEFHLRFAVITSLQENAKTNIGAWDLIASIMMTTSESILSFGHARHMKTSRQIKRLLMSFL